MLRKLRLSDVEAIQQINATALGYAVSVAQVQAYLGQLLADTDHQCLIGWADPTTDELQGYVQAELYQSLYAPAMFNVMGLAVAESAQHQGIGRALMTALEQTAQDKGLAGIRLNSGMSRTGAHQFYTRLGYISNKDQRRFYKEI
ncbi:GNAT family N-acetyltransferase [Lactiplantibacillus mudanjiangensis]|uniref:Phosphinothricin N-acetyltransferase [Lactobacillus sp. wkB8] n=1 Tax=Lactiplantibacillus mudanjiangensis TaxID=1296538 RepID=A0A660DXC6_9LACO|nr:GNAT family N-acetyltransferase [Lactiplantibacillus mudanjiangensis]VDG17515.1 Phosphinothricin N-acetyltransferase [Lactobacillus sp. wkB8] [Lactiplantibacillus mudanjiangensis]VDG24693.1 Phosphinothricin N-acetyltransferase [Lactobacillus sp. wkB8] [Lactiplantibacillus mudanjiangensis]VDG27718.1 Phosphinothricin N-acetyltransferase [Lactobacillus sp. wkB8] [Lactiplantibacillus mudanjiangensis]VDG32805.1 Phosphinothricin N-acetyltransferase [Lactobacillus sp. wkB8] [Lactiplantibacillus mud